MKRIHRLFGMIFVILMMATAVACGGAAAPAAPVENLTGEVQILQDPISPPDFEGDPTLAAILDQDMGYVLVPAGLTPEGCMDAKPLVKTALTTALESFSQQGTAIPEHYKRLCISPAMAAFVHNGRFQTLAFSLRDKTLFIYADGLEVGRLQKDGVERVLEIGENMSLIPPDIQDGIDFVYAAAQAMQVTDFDLLLYTWRFTYSHIPGEQEVTYPAEVITTDIAGEIDVTAVVTPTQTINGAVTTITTVYPAGMIVETHTPGSETSDERVTVEWPPLTRQAEIDAAAEAEAEAAAQAETEAAAQAAEEAGCWVTVAAGDGPLTTAGRVAAKEGLTASQRQTLETELMAQHATGPWFAGQTVAVSCPENNPGPSGRELGGAQPQADTPGAEDFVYILESGPLPGETPAQAAARLARQGGFDQFCLRDWFGDGDALGLFAPGKPLPLPAICLAGNGN